jgi:hypothetical protein
VFLGSQFGKEAKSSFASTSASECGHADFTRALIRSAEAKNACDIFQDDDRSISRLKHSKHLFLKTAMVGSFVFETDDQTELADAWSGSMAIGTMSHCV